MSVADETRQVVFAEELADAFTESGADFHTVTSYAEDGMLTRDAGFTVTMTDGAVFQVTVVQRAPAEGQEW
ncbi:MAG: hypothetical protein ACRDRO_02890 [Pseudonocardiaceae bacterium]